MPQTLDQAVQNAYSDLYAACLTPAFDGKGVSFTRKNIKGQRYIYISTKVGQVPVQKYIGPDNSQTRKLIEQEKQHWHSTDSARTTRARLVNMVLAGGLSGPTAQEGKILRMLERAGVFLSGGVLIGTPAFRVMGAMLGVAWRGQFATRQARQLLDVLLDIRPGSVSVAVEAARQTGAKFHRQYKKAAIRLPADLQSSLREWTV